MNIRKLAFVTGLALGANFVGQAKTAITNAVNSVIEVGQTFDYEAPANSLTVIRLKAK